MSKKYKINTVKSGNDYTHHVIIDSDFSLFRFRPVNDYTISALLNDYFWATRPDAFNDPYDSSFSVDVKLLKDKLLSLIDDELILEYGKLRKIKPLNKKYIAKKWVEEIYHETIYNLKKLYLVSCFSSKIDNEAMWAHYASNATGFAIEYYYSDLILLKDNYSSFVKDATNDLPEQIKEFKDFVPKLEDNDLGIFGINPIFYKNSKFNGTDLIAESINVMTKLLSIHDYSFLDVVKLFQDSGMKMYDNKQQKIFIDSTLFSKKRLWEYEAEWRMVVPNLLVDLTKINQAHHNIGKIYPKAIYLGEHATESTKTIVYNYCFTRGVPLYQMSSKINHVNYSLKYNQVSHKEMGKFLDGKTKL